MGNRVRKIDLPSLVGEDLSFYESPVTTATGSAQSLAHGMKRVPKMVLVVPVGGHDGSSGPGTQFPTIAEGTHTSTNVVVTVTAGAKFRVLAF